MKTFTVRKEIYYSTVVEAETIEEAREKADKVEIELWDRDDSGIEIDEDDD